jgi:hypothetical protein
MLNTARKRLKQFAERVLLTGSNQSPQDSRGLEQLWSIGIYGGESPFDLRPPENVDHPVLSRRHISDVRAAFVADPFMISVEGTWYMFFEVWNCQSGKGEIGLATSQDGLRWTYQQIVLAEPFHVSYPYVFEWRNNYYLVPESYQAGSVRLYRAVDFPNSWAFVSDLLTGPYFTDASVFRHDGRWWMYVETNPGMKHDTLRLYSADDLPGPWREHPKSPVMSDGHCARPAGRVLCWNDRIIRYAQNCDPVYGAQVLGFEVTDLSGSSYEERELSDSPLLTGTGVGWNASGMHHVDAHLLADGRWLACVDGWRAVSAL